MAVDADEELHRVRRAQHGARCGLIGLRWRGEQECRDVLPSFRNQHLCHHAPIPRLRGIHQARMRGDTWKCSPWIP